MIKEFGDYVIQDMIIAHVGDTEYLFIEGERGSMYKFNAETCEEIDKLEETSHRHDIIGMAFLPSYNCIIIGD